MSSSAMMNETEVPSMCPQLSYMFWRSGDHLQWFSINLILPLFILIGLGGHWICLRAFRRQARNEKAYVYQIYQTGLETFSLTSFATFMLAYQWSGANTLVQGSFDGLRWFRGNYALMFFAAHVAIPVCNGASIATLLLSLSMAVDRVFAFTKPFVYKNLDHPRHQAAALVLSVSIGFAAVAYNTLLFDVVDDGATLYLLSPNIPYLMTTTATALAYTCNVIRMVGLMALIGCNVALIRLYKRRLINVGGQGGQQGKEATRKEAQRKSTEKTLALLTLYQSLFVGVGTLSYVLFYTWSYTVPTFNACEQHLFAPLLDTVLMMCDTANVVATVWVNKKTRRVVGSFANFFRGWKLVKEQVHPGGQTTGLGGGGGGPSTNGHTVSGQVPQASGGIVVVNM